MSYKLPADSVDLGAGLRVTGSAASQDEPEPSTINYREIGKAQNTVRAYSSAVNHFRFKWGGFLPASEGSVCDYLTDYAGKLKVSTLRLHLAGLSKWHKNQGFDDPTAHVSVKETMKGIAKHHAEETKQAHPLTIRHLVKICDRLEAQKREAIQTDNQGAILRIHRDLALILLGFWYGFRSDELSRVEAQNVTAERDKSINVFLSHSKGDADARGARYQADALRAYCPVAAYLDWIQVSGIKTGAVFRSITRWGRLAQNGINKQSIEYILNKAAEGLFPDEPAFSTHSLRRGFADWAVSAGWDMNTIMKHVKWQSTASAQRYMPISKDYGPLAIPQSAKALSTEPSIGHGDTLIGQHVELDDEA